MTHLNQKVEIVETAPRITGWSAFEKLPWHVYKNDPNWVPPLLYEQRKMLNANKNPLFSHIDAKYWIAKKNGKVVGRIAAFIDQQYIDHYQSSTGFFGYFECLHDIDISSSLLNVAEKWLANHGILHVSGPINLSVAHECGLLMEGFHTSPFIQMTHNPGYYGQLIIEHGYEKETDLLAYFLPTPKMINDPKLERLKAIAERSKRNSNIRFRNIDPGKFRSELELIRILFNDFMKDNWGHIPISSNEFAYMTRSLRDIFIPELAIFAEADGQAVGFSVAIPDINEVLAKMNGKLFPFGFLKFLHYRSSVRNIRVMLMGVKKEYRKKGIEACFIHHTISACIRRPYEGAELSWIVEDNRQLISELEFLDAKLHKRYRIFRKQISFA